MTGNIITVLHLHQRPHGHYISVYSGTNESMAPKKGLLLLLLLLRSHPRVWYHSSSCRCSSIPLPRHVLYDGAAAAIINIYGDTIQKRAVPVVVALIVTIVFLTLYVGLLYALVRLSILGAISS